MAENKKSATQNNEKVMTKYDRKVQKRKEAELAAKKQKNKSRLINAAIIVVLIAIVAYFPIRKTVALTSTYMQVGDYKVTELEYDYYYNLSVSNYVSQYSYLLSYMGLDTTKDFADQQYGEYMTWDDFFQEAAVENIRQAKALYKAATEAGFEYDATADVELHIATIEDAAAENSMTLKNYVKAAYGKYATIKNLTPFIEESYYAAAYYDKVYEDWDITADEITAYYNQNVNDYDSVDYRVITVEAELPEEETEPTDEQVTAAMEAAKEVADGKLAVLDTEGVLTEGAKYSSTSGYYVDWLYDAERKAGDTTVIEDTTNNKYYVVKFEKRYLSDRNSVNTRIIATAEDKGAAIVEEWKNTGANEDAFKALVTKYSEDTYSNTNGGLYEGVVKSDLSTDLGNWLWDESRVTGDVGTVSVEGGYYYVLYYLGQGDVEWKASIDATLRSGQMEAFVLEKTEALEVVDTKGKLTYIEAVAAEESAAAANATE